MIQISSSNNNATCSICGKSYEMCISCKNKMALYPWTMHTDTSEHYKVFQILKGYSIRVFTKEEARERFKNVDLSDKNSYKPHIVEAINKILDEDMEEKTEEKPVESKFETGFTKTRTRFGFNRKK